MTDQMRYGRVEEFCETLDDQIRSRFGFFNNMEDHEYQLEEGGYNIITDDPLTDDVKEFEIYYRIKATVNQPENQPGN